jgi:hypothetical protein
MSSAQVKNINTYVTRFIAENGTDEMLEAWNNRNTKSFNENLLPPPSCSSPRAKRIQTPNICWE